MIQKIAIESIPYTQLNLTMPIVEADNELISGLRAGNRKAQENFYKEYFPSMFPIAFRFSSTKEEAQEIINTAFLTVIKTINNYKQ